MDLNRTVSSLRRRSCSYVSERLRDFSRSPAMQQRRDATSDRLTACIQAALSSQTLADELQRQINMRRVPPASTHATSPASLVDDAEAEAEADDGGEMVLSITATDSSHVIDISDPTNSRPPGSASTAGGGATSTDNSPIANQLQQIYQSMQGVLPFVGIAAAKLIFDHRLGMLMFIGLFGTFYHANSALLRNITETRAGGSSSPTISPSTRGGGLFKVLCGVFRRDNFLFSNAWIIGFLVLNISLVYLVFSDQHLYLSLVFQLPLVQEDIDHLTFWTLLWVVGVTDFVARFVTIIFKTVINILPRFVIPLKEKGRYYMLIERISQFYRSLTPVRPWLAYLYDVRTSATTWFSVVAVIAYIVFKILSIYTKMKQMKGVLRNFRNNSGYGVKPSIADMNLVDNSCPICKDIMKEPLQLTCSHIFCDACICQWFDREKTCPLCRQAIVEQPMWRDGSTQDVPILC